MVLTLAVVWMVGPAAGQDGSASAGRSPDAAADLLRELTDLVGTTGTDSNQDLVKHLSAALQDPALQSMLKNMLEDDGIGSDVGTLNSASRPIGLLRLLSFSLVGLVLLVFAGAILVARIVFALSVFVDGRRLIARSIPTLFMGPALWALAVVIGGMLVVALYWLVHHSTLSTVQGKE